MTGRNIQVSFRDPSAPKSADLMWIWVDLGGSEAPQQSGQHLCHYYVDVPNREDNNVESNDQHISMDP